MHLLRIESRSIDGTADAVDLDQTPADIVALSFTDTDLSVLAAAWEAQPELPSLRLANLSLLRHPYSVDLYIEKVLSKARFVLVRLLGGKDYWRYGVDELAAIARSREFALAVVPGDHRDDPRLDEASTVEPGVPRRISAYFAAGGVENVGACLRFIAGLISPLSSSRNLPLSSSPDLPLPSSSAPPLSSSSAPPLSSSSGLTRGSVPARTLPDCVDFPPPIGAIDARARPEHHGEDRKST